MWERKNVLVTGGNGLMGGPLCKRLLEAGAMVTVYDTSTRGVLEQMGLLKDVHFIRDTILALTRLRGAVRQQDVVFHLAAISGVEQSRASKMDAFEVNVRGTWLVLQACLEEGNQQAIVTASSNHIYGDHDGEPTLEDSALRQLDTYSATKVMADYCARAYAHNYALPIAVVRNTNCYGANDPHSDHLIPGTILSVMAGEAPVIRSKGITQKSYLYVDDVIDAYMRVAEYTMTQKVYGLAFNVSDERVSVNKLVSLICELMSFDKEPIVLGQANDQADENMDSSLVRNLTGWKPQHTLREGLEKAITGFKVQRGRFGYNPGPRG